jgi:hypothetical protein
MTSSSLDHCLHGDIRLLGLLPLVPAGWTVPVGLPSDISDGESAWCRACESYVWRELGSPDWTALDPPR